VAGLESQFRGSSDPPRATCLPGRSVAKTGHLPRGVCFTLACRVAYALRWPAAWRMLYAVTFPGPFQTLSR